LRFQGRSPVRSILYPFSLYGLQMISKLPASIVMVVVGTSTLIRAEQVPAPDIDANGSVHASPFVLPESALLGPATRRELDRALRADSDLTPTCGSDKGASAERILAIRRCEIEEWRQSADRKALFDKYSVQMASEEIAGVHADVFTPAGGIAAKNRHRVLINVHGGGFLGGARISSEIESVPIAAVGRIKVYSLDYRMAPLNKFPAASEDVAKVYREMLKHYSPENIGIFGCSAGGLLTAQSVAWFQKAHLPRPGAVALLCEGGFFWGDGDSGVFDRAITGGIPERSSRDNAYLRDADPNDPLAFPATSASVLAQFPPTLLVSATRDMALSSVVRTHSLLIANGVEAELHVFEGLWHAFQYDTSLPESGEVFGIVARFFDTHLGRS
jgi:epsilon-lactone hydrolase